MKQFWSWGGNYIGVQQGDYLAACNGTVVGKFYGHEIYSQEGCYIGEIGRDNRLFKDAAKAAQRRSVFSYGIRGTINFCYRDIPAYPLIAGQEDFIAATEQR